MVSGRNNIYTNDLGKTLLKTERYFILGKITYFFAIAVHTVWLFLFYFLGFKNMALFNIFSILAFLLCLYLNKKRKFLLAVSIATIEILLHQVLAVIFLGLTTGFQNYLFALIFLPFLTDKKNLPIKFLLSASIIVTYMYLDFNFKMIAPIYMVEENIALCFNEINILFSLLLICVWAYYFNNSVNIAEEALEKEQEKAENLLHNILPIPIAAQLREGRVSIAEGFDVATVLFLDIVGFTKLSSSKTPNELVDILNIIFSQIDDLCEKYKLEKIKTIGDSYMVASGIPEFHPDHAIQMADFSLELQKVFSDINKELGTSLQIRTGINSGPVVAGVIGKKKFIYDLWGDAVNVASRMESHGVIGKVQVSDSTYQLLKGHFTLSDNGEKEIKGKGPMKTYILEARIL
jgi:class 3 adenylate cyclase